MYFCWMEEFSLVDSLYVISIYVLLFLHGCQLHSILKPFDFGFLNQRFWIENSQADQTPYSATYGANHVWEVRLGRADIMGISWEYIYI